MTIVTIVIRINYNNNYLDYGDGNGDNDLGCNDDYDNNSDIIHLFLNINSISCCFKKLFVTTILLFFI